MERLRFFNNWTDKKDICKELLVDIDQENCEFNWVLMF